MLWTLRPSKLLPTPKTDMTWHWYVVSRDEDAINTYQAVDEADALRFVDSCYTRHPGEGPFLIVFAQTKWDARALYRARTRQLLMTLLSTPAGETRESLHTALCSLAHQLTLAARDVPAHGVY